MAIAPKGKRKIVVRGRTFYWCVKADPDSLFLKLSVLSPDKKFIVQYALGQSRSQALGWTKDWHPPFVEVLGGEFGGLEPAGVWQRVRTPAWDEDATITPAFVRRFIDWCLDTEKEVVRVDWQGQVLCEDGSTKSL
jgi:hypothetical protein